MTATTVPLTPAQSHSRGVLILLASTIAWSSAGLFVRAVPLDAFSMLVWRGPAGALGILSLLLWFDGRSALGTFVKMRSLAWLYTCISTATIVCFILALKLSTVAHVGIIYATVPFVAAALGFLFLGERPSVSAVLASLAALAGVAFMVSAADQGSSLLGDLLAGLMTLGSASMMVLSRQAPDVRMLPAASASALLAGLVAIPFAHHLPATPVDLGLVIAAGLVANTLGFGLFVIGSRLVPAVETALIGALEAPLAPLWVWLAFAETPSLTTILGGALVTLAVLGHLWISGQRKR